VKISQPISEARELHPFEYRVYSDPTQLTALAPKWDELVRTSPGNAAFRSIDWYVASCTKETSWVPFVVVACHDQEIICILPFVIDEKDRTAKFPHHGADYNDIIARPGNPSLVADLLNYAVSSCKGCRRLVLSRLRPDSCCVQAFQFLAQRTNVQCVRRDIDSYLHIQLSKSFDAYLESRSRAFRKDVRRTVRNLERENLVIRELCPRELDPNDLPLLLIRLALARHKEKCSFFRAPPGFHDEALPPLFKKRFLRAFAILRGTQIVALDLCMVTTNGLVTWNGGFLPEVKDCSPGTALFAFEIQQAIATGAREFDFTRGDEGYKQRWANSQYNVCEIELTLG